MTMSRYIHIGVLVMIVLISIRGFSVFAQTADELRIKIDQSNAQINTLQQEITAANQQLTIIFGQKNTLANEIQKLDLTQKTLSKQIALTEKKIQSSNLLIKQFSGQIVDKKDSISNQEQAIGIGIRTIAFNDSQSMIVSLLSKQNLSDSWKDIDQIITTNTSIKENIKKLNETKKELEGSRAKEESAKADLVLLNKDLTNQKNIIAQSKKEKDSLLVRTKNQESEYQKIVADKMARKIAFEKDVSGYESALKFILDPSSIPKDGSHVLVWPLDVVRVTQYFGKTVAAKKLYVSGSHNGVDFGAPVGTRVLAAASGKVIGTGDTDPVCPGASYGKWVLIRHNNGLTTVYGHLSAIASYEGQDVAQGQIIAYSGSTGYATGPHLHLSVFASTGVQVTSLVSKACAGRVYRIPIAAANAYLDPMLYLPKP
jgi:murein DD-endopeptidase MepM/ murein hydrolase activator NlpD